MNSKSCTVSTVTRKFVMAVSGLGLIGFVFFHLIGNLLLLVPGGVKFNEYAARLESLEPYLYIAEIGLVILFLVHIWNGIRIALSNRRARDSVYVASGSRAPKTKGGPSKMWFGSTYMAVSGTLLLIFLVIHIAQFKYGPGTEAGYTTILHGANGPHDARDLYRLVKETFENGAFVLFYVTSMLFLAMHLRHGFWSWFQSLGILYPKCSKAIYAIGLLVALALGGGFLIIPLWFYFGFAS